MEYSINDLRPSKPILKIGNKSLTISLITLHVEQILKESICDLKELHDTIQKTPLIIFDIIWVLLVEKNEFDFDIEKFKNFVYKQAKTVEVSTAIRNCLQESFMKSMPKIRNKQKYSDMLKISQAQNDDKVCYGVYYDKIAKRYGYSIDDFFNLTLGQLHILLKVSSDQNYEDATFQASLQGRKLQARMDYKDVDEKEDKKLDDDANEMLKKLQREYKVKHGK